MDACAQCNHTHIYTQYTQYTEYIQTYKQINKQTDKQKSNNKKYYINLKTKLKAQKQYVGEQLNSKIIELTDPQIYIIKRFSYSHFYKMHKS